MRGDSCVAAIVFRLQGGIRQFLILNYAPPYDAYWEFSKGAMEPGETALEALRRELFEEAGIDSAMVYNEFCLDTNYDYVDLDGTFINEQIQFFIMSVDDSAVNLSDEHIGYEWLPFDEAFERLTHEKSREVLEQANEFIGKSG